jgi:hypothetical protein
MVSVRANECSSDTWYSSFHGFSVDVNFRCISAQDLNELQLFFDNYEEIFKNEII